MSHQMDAAQNRNRPRPGSRGGQQDRYALELSEAGRAGVAAVGGKGAHLAELSRVGGVGVPPGFVVTAAAYRQVVSAAPRLRAMIDHLAHLDTEDSEGARALSAEIRHHIEQLTIPDEVERAITAAVRRFAGDTPLAVRSSATAEDSPTASFAGQHDTYLHVSGASAVLRHVTLCWASLFSERAVAYRTRNGIDHRAAEMAVVVQHLVAANCSGVMFTADPVSGHRKIVSVEATFGLGEALVAGTVNADTWQVRDGGVIDGTVASKRVAIRPSPGGGTHPAPVEPERQMQPALTDGQVLELAALGRRIEAHFGSPQDIEWCLDGDGFQIVQSRPITTLFPIPEVDDGADHVYISVGHQQMMTEPMTPLGLSVWQLTSPAPMRVAGGRLYVDVTAALSSPATRARLLEGFGRSDPLIADALETVIEQGDIVPPGIGRSSGVASEPGPTPQQMAIDPGVVGELIEHTRASVSALERAIEGMSGPQLFDFIAADIAELQVLLVDPRSHQALMAGFEATWWLNDKLAEWLGEQNAAAVLSLSAPHNVTAEMGLALLDVADVIRPHPQVIALLGEAGDDRFLDDLGGVPGGRRARAAITGYLDAYGMRCVGEIDIARPRWREQPSALVPALLSNVANFEPGERERRTEHGRRRAADAERELLRRLRTMPDGAGKAGQAEQMIRRMRAFVGYREYPKYGMVSRYFIYKQAMLGAGRRLVEDGALGAVDDIFFLTFHEFHDAVRTGHADRCLIARRRADMRRFAALVPPRVLTSDGEALFGAYRRGGVPAGALVGLAVSGGTIEGRARVVHDMADADLEPGDILVTAHTDPAWSPLFVTIAGLVTKAGGLMTHGSVIAREYGIAAVVGVEDATRAIPDGAHIRVDGTRGYVEILPGVA